MSGSLRLEPRARVLVATLTGELDISNISETGEELRNGVHNEMLGVCLDLSETRYIDSAGVRMIFDLATRLEACRQVLAVIVPENAPVRRLVEVTNLSSLVGVHPTVDAAIEYVEASARDLL